MYANANCYADVLRSAGVNSDGDEIDTGTASVPVYANVPFSIIEKSTRVSDPSTLIPRIIRVPVGRCKGDLKIQEDDQIYDRTHQRLYSITSASRGDSAVIASEWVLQLQRVTGGSFMP